MSMKLDKTKKLGAILRGDLGFVLLLCGVIFVYLFDLFTLRYGFLSGDHLAQHYPWASFLWDEIHHLRLPWWCPFNQCGFPLLAEGQVGAFYPPNLIFLGLLPFDIAYNYEVLFHYLVAGVGFYFYVRRIGLRSVAALLGAVIFLFGSAQGGFSYNITSQRVLAWFPICLLLIDCMLENPRPVYCGLLALVLALQAVAGYQQFSIYFYGFACFYFIFLLFKGPYEQKFKSFLSFALAVFLSIGLSLPQWIPFLELSQFSSRVNSVEALAYVGSLNPFGFATLYFPSWHGFLGTDFYVSVLGVFLAISGLAGRKNCHTWAVLALLVVSLLYALGKFDPLYVAFIKSTHFYAFRVPAKVLFFSSLCLSILAAMGFDKVLSGGEDQSVKRTRNIFFWLSAIVLLGFAASGILLRAGKDVIYPIAEQYVKSHFGGSVIHPYSIEVYLAKLKSVYDVLLLQTDIFNPRIITAVSAIIVSVFATFWIKRISPWVFILIISVDLFLFGLISVKGNYESFAVTRPKSKILDMIKHDKARFRVLTFMNEADAQKGRQYPSFPNFNVYPRIEDVGIYSPFAMKLYKQFLGGLGSVNDSLFLSAGSRKALFEKRELLNFLSVKYIVSGEPLSDFSLICEENGFYLYENRDWHSRYSGIDDVKEVERKSGRVLLQANAKESGELVVSEINYPGWKSFIDGKEVVIKPYQGLFRSVDVPMGAHQIEFRYTVSRFNWTFVVAGLMLGVCFLCILSYSRLS
ncbi:MAG: hypothetical protein HZC17_02585 [Candidatus Omnitrophica bacterium]|nr:hypothetical protein [Candidatus Omnitrophota bacterium]